MGLSKPLALLAAGVIAIVVAALDVAALRPLILAFPFAPDSVGSELYPWGVAVNPAANRVYVANMGSATVAVVDGAAGQVIATIPLEDGPNAAGPNGAASAVGRHGLGRAPAGTPPARPHRDTLRRDRCAAVGGRRAPSYGRAPGPGRGSGRGAGGGGRCGTAGRCP
jgi:YVTN family beta-propeller protein